MFMSLIIAEVRTFITEPAAPETVAVVPTDPAPPQKKKALFSKLGREVAVERTSGFADEIMLYESTAGTHEGMLDI